MEKHDLADYVRILARGKNASRNMTLDEAYFTMSNMLQGNYRPEQLGAIFMLMRVLEEDSNEIAGFAKAIEEAFPADLNVDLIWPSYAGKRRQPFWCFLSALLLTQMGYRILFHGTVAHTEGRMYLHQVFDYFGLPQVSRDMLFDSTATADHSNSLAYLPCSELNPVLQQWLLLKSVLGVRSPINSVLKTISAPGVANVQGVFHPNYKALHRDAARVLQHDAIIIKGEGGEFEVNPERACVVHYCLAGELGEWSIDNDRSLFDDKPEGTDNGHLAAFWQGTLESEYAYQAVIKTAALALCSIKKSSDYGAAFDECARAWECRNRQQLMAR
jgi:anthranilate phosphoribosyltransferase